MPWSRDSYATIAARVKADIQGALASTAAFWRMSFERGVADALAGSVHGIHAHLAWLALQLNPSTCDDDVLESVHAGPWGVYKRTVELARFTGTATGTNGTSVPATSTVYVRTDGARYTVDVTQAVAGGSVTLALTAVIAGALANVDVGTVLTVETPIPGLASTLTVTVKTQDGADAETPESLLARVLQRRQSPIRGGAHGDYTTWAMSVSGVSRAWEYPGLEGSGTITVYALNDVSGVPTALTSPKLAEIVTYMDQPGRQPVTAGAFVRTPTFQTIPMTIAISPNTTAVQDAIATEIDDYYLLGGHPGGMTILTSQLNEAISIAAGEFDHAMTIPAGNVTVPIGSYPKRGTITWSTL